LDASRFTLAVIAYSAELSATRQDPIVGEPAVGHVKFDAVWSHMRRDHVRASVAAPPCGPMSAREFVSTKDRTGRQRLRATKRPAHSAKGYHTNTMDTRAGNDTLTDRSPATPPRGHENGGGKAAS
jgi:hypothetical protein